MKQTSNLEIEIRPKFVIDEDTAYQCLTLLEMYCNANDSVVTWYRSKNSSDDEWKINLEFTDIDEVLGKHKADVHGNEYTINDAVNTCKKYDSEYVDGETALSINYIFGKLIPAIEKKAAKDERNKVLDELSKYVKVTRTSSCEVIISTERIEAAITIKEWIDAFIAEQKGERT